MGLIYGSVCSGIEAASVAWHPLGWRASFLSEIEAFPRAVLSHHYPTVPLHGDFTTINDGDYAAIDLLVGGTPCQDFSIAGLRAGMAGDRGNLTLQFLTLARRLRPKWLVWENVPGVLSSNGGRDFGAFLGGLGELRYGWAYRTLDAQFFGVPQRRRRVFVVGYLGDWRRAAAVLFERHSLQGHPPPRREAGAGVAAGTLQSTDGGSDLEHGRAGHLIAGTLCNNGKAAGSATQQDAETGYLVAHSLRGEGFDASEDGTGRGTPLVPAFAIQERAVCENVNAGPQGVGFQEGVAYTLEARNKTQYVASEALAFAENTRHELRLEGGDGQRTGALSTGGGKPGQGTPTIAASSGVRRLTPRECERLQGFPDDYTLVPYRGKPAADGPRYKALGNSMAVPVMAWIGQRIQQVEALGLVPSPSEGPK